MTGKRIFGAFTVAVTLFAFWPAVVGKWQSVRALRDGVSQREELLKQRKSILANLAAVHQEYEQQTTQENGRNLLAVVPVHKDVAELISALQAIATRTGALIIEIQVTEDTTQKDAVARTLGMHVDLSGSYNALRAFLAAMEQEVRLLNVTDISVSEASTGGLRFSIAADAYFIE